jgi:hypothetical protein
MIINCVCAVRQAHDNVMSKAAIELLRLTA